MWQKPGSDVTDADWMQMRNSVQNEISSTWKLSTGATTRQVCDLQLVELYPIVRILVQRQRNWTRGTSCRLVRLLMIYRKYYPVNRFALSSYNIINNWIWLMPCIYCNIANNTLFISTSKYVTILDQRYLQCKQCVAFTHTFLSCKSHILKDAHVGYSKYSYKYLFLLRY